MQPGCERRRLSRLVGAAGIVWATATVADAQSTASLTTSSYTQNYNTMTSSSAAALPTGWLFASGATPTWSGTANTAVTTKSGGMTGTGALATTSAGGAYVFVDGILASGSDKGIGFLSSGGYTSPRSILFGFTNNSTSDASSLSVGWDYEKYRDGSRAFDWKFYGSADGANWTAISGGNQAYASGTNATLSAVSTTTISPFSIAASVGIGSSYYLRWDYVGSGGSSNAQALGIDNFTLSLTGTAAPPPAVTGLFWVATPGSAGVGGSGTWTASGATFATTVDGTSVGVLAAAGDATFAGTAGTVTVSGTVTPPGGLQFSTTGYTVEGGAIAFSAAAASTITTGSGVAATVNSALTQTSGSAALVKAGGGSLTLGGNNTYAGGTTISSGTLAAAANSALGSGNVTLGAGTLVVASGVTLGNAIVVSATGSTTGSLVAGWDFQTAPGTAVTTNTGTPPTPNLYVANFGSGTLALDGSNGSSTWTAASSNTELNAFAGTAVNAGAGFSTTTTSPAALALVAGGATTGGFSANGKSAVFTVDMTGKQNLVVSLAEQRSTTGFTTETWSYSTDGATWTTFQTLGVNDIPTNFGLVTLNAISGLNNAPKAYVKVTLDGATATSGNVRLDNIQFNASALGSTVSAAATIGTDVEGGIAEFSGPVSLGASVNVLAAANATVIFSGTIAGGGGIRKTGDGTVILQADNTFTGGATVEAGQIRLGAGGATGSVAGSVQLLTPATSLVIDRSDDLAFATALSGSGGLFKEGGNTVTLTGGNSYTGGTTLFAGTLVVGDGGTQGAIAATGPVDLSPGTRLAFDRSDDVVLSGSVTGDGTVVQAGVGKLTLAQAGGLGSTTLRVENGVVDLNRGGASLVGMLGAGNTVELAGGVLQLTSDSEQETRFTGAAIRVEADSTLAINRTGAAGNHATTDFNVPFTLANTGTLTFDFRGAFSSSTLPVVQYKGTTTYTGTVSLESSAGIGVTNSSGGTAEVIFAAPVVDGGNGFGIVKVGDEVLTLAAANTFTGATTVSQGTLKLAAANALASSAVTVAAGATLAVGPQVQAVVPSLVNNGLVDVGRGRLTVTAGLTATAVAAQINAGIVGGGTTGITSSDAAPSGGAFTVGWLDNFDGSYTFGYAAAGDTNLDGVVDLTDLLGTVGSGKYDTSAASTWSDGDANYDGVVDLTDLLSLVGGGLYDQGDYNAGAGSGRLLTLASGGADPGAAAVTAVPEPSMWTLAVAAAGMLPLMVHRRRRKPVGLGMPDLPLGGT